MREIRRHALKTITGSTHDTKTGITLAKLNELRLLVPTQPSPFDATTAYEDKRERTYQQQAVLIQCMNAVDSPTKTTPKRKLKVKVRVSVRGTQRKRGQNNSFLTIVPGTPEEDPDPDLTIYYKVLNEYKPELGESNAESVARTTAFEAEYQYLLMKKTREKQNKNEKIRNPRLHALSPSTPPKETVAFKTKQKSRHIQIEPNKQPDRDRICHNNVQEITLETDYSLYPTQEKPIQHQPINLIYDTGAAISMLPAEYEHAWTNVRECLHTLVGCFAGHSETNLMIGEFHAILTLDSKETVRVIIPECIQIPPGKSNTYLISNSAFLLAQHTYVSHLSRPKLRFKGGGTYTMSVTKGHMLISVLPTHAERETTHRRIYVHNDEPYDPPTFVNTVLYNCSNRPNANTPTAFTWHLRYGCKCAHVLRNT